MADPTVPWGIPLFDDNTPFAPIQAPFNSQSAALNDALSDGAFAPYTTKALLDAAPGARVGQHATVYADGTPHKNGDYKWGGSAWIQTFSTSSGLPFAMASGSATNTDGASKTVTFPPGRFTVPPRVTMANTGPSVSSLNAQSVTTDGFSGGGYNSSGIGIASSWFWIAVQMTPTSTDG